ncbi:Protein of unknown function [Weissella confusa LBAE C39-2]|nr:Protein of unknown function [Weissella confusa LBAE C39-2]
MTRYSQLAYKRYI